MSALQSFLEYLDGSPYDADCIDDMTHHFAPVRGEFYYLDDGRVGVDWFNKESKRLKYADGTATDFYHASVFWDAIERRGLLRAGVAARYGGTVYLSGGDEDRLHSVIETIRELTQFFETEAALAMT